jgi:hypothetical protein
MICNHVGEFGTAPDGRLFRTYRGGLYVPSTLWQVLHKARPHAFTEPQVASPLARKPYDFRHAGVSWRLNAGIPARCSTSVACWRCPSHCWRHKSSTSAGQMTGFYARPPAASALGAFGPVRGHCCGAAELRLPVVACSQQWFGRESAPPP